MAIRENPATSLSVFQYFLTIYIPATITKNKEEFFIKVTEIIIGSKRIKSFLSLLKSYSLTKASKAKLLVASKLSTRRLFICTLSISIYIEKTISMGIKHLLSLLLLKIGKYPANTAKALEIRQIGSENPKGLLNP